MLRNRGFPEARSHLCVCQSLLPHDLCHERSSSHWLLAQGLPADRRLSKNCNPIQPDSIVTSYSTSPHCPSQNQEDAASAISPDLHSIDLLLDFVTVASGHRAIDYLACQGFHLAAVNV